MRSACRILDRRGLEFAARYQDGKLPAALVFEREEPKLGVTIFRVDPEAITPR